MVDPKYDILPFTALQNAIDWDPRAREYALKFKNRKWQCKALEKDETATEFEFETNDRKSDPLKREEIALLLSDFKKADDIKAMIEAQASIYFNLMDLASDCGLYESGVFGASYVNAGNDSGSADDYGKTEKHLPLGSLNIPSENLGKDKVHTAAQYYYFSASRETEAVIEEEEGDPAAGSEAKDKGSKSGRYPSEVKQILGAADGDISTERRFINKWECNSKALYVRWEYLILLILKNIENIKRQRRQQIETLKRQQIELKERYSDFELEKKKILKDLIFYLVNATETSDQEKINATLGNFLKQFRPDLGFKADRLAWEIRELLILDPKRFKWFEQTISDDEIRRNIKIVLDKNQKLNDEYPLKRPGVAKWYSAFHRQSENSENFLASENLKGFPSLDLPYQAYLRLMASNPVGEMKKKKLLLLDHMVVPLNSFDRSSGKGSTQSKEDLRLRYFRDTTFMVVALENDTAQKNVYAKFNNDERDFVNHYTNLLGTFNAIALQFLVIPAYVKLNEKTRELAVRSALNAIMARNGSHNLGSHVLYNVIKDINHLNVQDNKLLFKYLQHRMDFLAQVATSWVPDWTSSSWLVKEIMRGFFEQRHMLEYIAKAEGFHMSESGDGRGSRIWSRIYRLVSEAGHDATIIQIGFGLKSDGSSDPANLDEDIMLAIPGGAIGFHALYTIVENFIRNSAKHDFATLPKDYQDRKDLRINLEIEEANEKQNTGLGYKIRIWSNLSYISTICEGETDVWTSFFENSGKGFDITCAQNTKEFIHSLETAQTHEDFVVIRLTLKHNSVFIDKIKNSEEYSNVEEGKNDFFFFIHPYENQEAENCEGAHTCRPKLMNNFGDLIRAPHYRFISQPRWEAFFNQCKKDDGTFSAKLMSFLACHYQPIHKQIQLKLDKPLIDGDSNLRKEDWGLSEIKICAAYLSRKQIGEIGEEKSSESFLRAIAIPEMTEKGPEHNAVRTYRFGYEFFIPKPKEILFITDETQVQSANRNIFEKHGVHFDVLSECFKTNMDYDLVVFSKEGWCELLKLKKKKEMTFFDIMESFPYRVISLDSEYFTENETNRNDDQDAWEFIKSRVAHIEQAGFSDDDFTILWDSTEENMITINRLKLKLYETWIQHLRSASDQSEGETDNIFLLIKTEGSPTNTSSESDDLGKNKYEEIGHIIKDSLDPAKLNGVVNKILEERSQDANNREITQLDFGSTFEEDDRAKELLNESFDDETFKKIAKNVMLRLGFFVANHRPATLPDILHDSVVTESDRSFRAYAFGSDIGLIKLSYSNLNVDFKQDARIQLNSSGRDDRQYVVDHNRCISYLRHLTLCAALDCEGKNECGETHHPIYDENLSGAATHFSLFSHMPNQSNKDDYLPQKLALKLIENGLLRIAIADERTWSYMWERRHSKSFRQLISCGIYPVNKLLRYQIGPDDDGAEPEMSCINILDAKESRINMEIKRRDKDYLVLPNVLIIHQGILDKIDWELTSFIGDGEKTSESIFINAAKRQIPFVVITSGRGKPSLLADNAKFIGFSIIENSLLSAPHSKLILTDALMKILNKSTTLG